MTKKKAMIDTKGGMMKMWNLFGYGMDKIIDELNK
jgi:hypothetical protein